MLASLIATLGPVAVKLIMMLFDHFKVKKENKRKFLQDVLKHSGKSNALILKKRYEALLDVGGWK
jgi:hypothetical protein